MPTRNDKLTNTHNRSLQLRRRHLLQHADPRLSQGEQASKFHCPLLELQFRTGGVFGQDLRYPVLFWHGGGTASSDLRHRSQYKLADEVVGVRRVEDGEDEVDEVFVGDLEGGELDC